MASGNFTLFNIAGGGGGGSASSYLQNNFDDMSTAATVNTGFTDNSNTNPLAQWFQNDDCPRFSVKTLWVKDLVLIEDRTQWINNSPTYQVVWSENFPAVHGYAVGNVRVKNFVRGKTVDIKNIGDIFGVGGVIRQVAWIVNPDINSPGTAQLWTDGVNTGNTIDFSSDSTDNYNNGLNKYNLYLHNNSLSTYDLHDYRLISNQYFNLSVAGVVVYFQNTGSNIDLFPGTTYVNKAAETTSSISTAALPTPGGGSLVGSKTVIAKTTSNTYALTSVDTPYVSTIAQGSSGTNLLTVTTGQGASFPIATGVVGVFGTSFYVGTVSNQSTDTLTVFPTLPFGVSGLLYKSWRGGPTLAIGNTLYSLNPKIDVINQNAFSEAHGFNRSLNDDFYYSDPEQRYRIWGRNLQITGIEGYPALGWQGNTVGFVQVEGNFCAAEIELVGAGIINGTFAINGLNSWGLNEGFSGLVKKTVFTEAGPGFNMFSFSPGQSFINCAIKQINLYQRAIPVNVTLGQLATFDTNVTNVPRLSSLGSTTANLGGWQRNYADHLFLQGSWVRGQSFSAAGGVYYSGSSTNSVIKFQFYGSQFGIIGTAGSSAVLTLDGASIAVNFNTGISTTLGWHTIAYTHQNGTSIINAIDFLKANQAEFKNLQKFAPRSELATIPVVYNQSTTPEKSKDGDYWILDKSNRIVYIKLMGVWNRLQINEFSDDPNETVFIRAFGSNSTNATAAGGQSDLEAFNNSSWNASLPSDSVGGARSYGSASEGSYNNQIVVGGGQNTAGTVLSDTRQFNKTSWSGGGALPAAREAADTGQLTNFYYLFGGGSPDVSTIYQYNGSSWTNLGTLLSHSKYSAAVFRYASTLRIAGGGQKIPAALNDHDVWNGTSISTDTVVPVSTVWGGGSRIGANGIIWGSQSNVGTGTASYQWSGSWSAAITTSFGTNNSAGGGTEATSQASGFSQANQNAVSNGGYNSGTGQAINSSMKFNGTSWATFTSSNNSRGASSGGSI